RDRAERLRSAKITDEGDDQVPPLEIAQRAVDLLARDIAPLHPLPVVGHHQVAVAGEGLPPRASPERIADLGAGDVERAEDVIDRREVGAAERKAMRVLQLRIDLRARPL